MESIRNDSYGDVYLDYREHICKAKLKKTYLLRSRMRRLMLGIDVKG